MCLYYTISLRKREIENIYGTLSSLAWVGENNLKYAYRVNSAVRQIGVCRTGAGAPLASPGGKLSPKSALRNRFWRLMRNGEIFQLPVQCVKKHHIGTQFVQLMRICSCSCRRSSSTASRSPFPPGEGICSVHQGFKHQFADLLSQADKHYLK